ncbi:MAG: alcohol dehydrogenase [Acidobacteria bacterium]|nr:MAG: alcohol dehydrogenase [Acidobacteriota bacterium]
MLAARLHGSRDIRIEKVLAPPGPEAGQALIKVEATGICGSDLHTYLDARIGDIQLQSPLVLGHEFAGSVVETGAGARDGHDDPLQTGRRVAVDPATPCHCCEFCQKGHPNLCRRLHFCGLWPDDGSLVEYIRVPARSCFPLPDQLTCEEGALLEPLGVALHAVSLAHMHLEESVAILGAGPIGLLILKVALLSGARPIIVTDRFPWRLDVARRFGADHAINIEESNPIDAILELTRGRGVDVVFEAAWGGAAAEAAIEIGCLGARIIMVGIPTESQLTLPAAPARRKGLTVRFSRRMKHTYSRTIPLVADGRINIRDLITHRLPLTQADKAFAMNAAYEDAVVKVVVGISGG